MTRVIVLAVLLTASAAHASPPEQGMPVTADASKDLEAYLRFGVVMR